MASSKAREWAKRIGKEDFSGDNAERIENAIASQKLQNLLKIEKEKLGEEQRKEDSLKIKVQMDSTLNSLLLAHPSILYSRFVVNTEFRANYRTYQVSLFLSEEIV